jgi:hypothetical protein
MTSPTPSTTGNTEDFTNIPKDVQTQLAGKIIGMFISRVHKDETTDFTGYTITKKRLGEHAEKVIRDIEGGALQRMKNMGRF